MDDYAEKSRAPLKDSLYERDFYAWTQEQAKAVRERRFEDIDIKNLVDEVETLGRAERNEIGSRLLVLLVHLLKWRFQPERRGATWEATIMEQRDQIAETIADNPSLRLLPGEILDKKYRLARIRAAGETELPKATFPEPCPFSLEDVLDDNFWPEGA